MSVEIVYETHSMSVDNERGIATGWLDGQLSERGKELARDLGARRRDDGIAAVFTSDLGRAVETAEIAFRGSGIPIHRDGRLRECNYGELNGQPLSRFEAEPQRRIDVPTRLVRAIGRWSHACEPFSTTCRPSSTARPSS